MKFLYALAFGFTCLFVQKEPASVTESFKLVNDLNAAENKPAIYMCREVNGFWGDYLTEPKSEDIFEKSKFQRRLDTITKYVGGNLAGWKKSFPFIQTWQPRVKAAEYVSYRGLDINAFYAKNHSGVYLYSLPLFNADRTKALIYVWYMGAHNVTLDNYYYCEKQNGIWNRKSVVLIGGFNNR